MLLLLVNRRRICGTVSRSITIIGAVHWGIEMQRVEAGSLCQASR
jgi:hypothetical protein